MSWKKLRNLVAVAFRQSRRHVGPCRTGLTIESLENRTLLSYTFTLIADTSPSSPYSGFSIDPQISTSGQVAFEAEFRAGGRGIFRDDGTTIATTGGDLSNLFALSTNSSGTVVFFGIRADGSSGLFMGDGSSDPVPIPTDSFQRVGGARINDQGVVAFSVAFQDGTQGIVTWDGTNLQTLYGAADGFTGDFGQTPINDNGVVAFSAFRGLQGIYAGDGGPFLTIADTSGNTFNNFDFSPAIDDNGLVAFRGFLRAGGEVIDIGDGTQLTTLARTGGPYNSFEGVAMNNQGTTAFYASLRAGGNAILAGPDAVADRVIGNGDSLFGSSVAGLNTANSPGWLSDNGQVVFRAHLFDGRDVIARADPAGGSPHGGANDASARTAAVASVPREQSVGTVLAATEASAVRLQRVDAQQQPLEKSDSFQGNGPSQGVRNMPEGRVPYQDVDPGADLVYHGSQRRQSEDDWVDWLAAPGGDSFSPLTLNDLCFLR